MFAGIPTALPGLAATGMTTMTPSTREARDQRDRTTVADQRIPIILMDPKINSILVTRRIRIIEEGPKTRTILMGMVPKIRTTLEDRQTLTIRRTVQKILIIQMVPKIPITRTIPKILTIQAVPKTLIIPVGRRIRTIQAVQQFPTYQTIPPMIQTTLTIPITLTTLVHRSEQSRSRILDSPSICQSAVFGAEICLLMLARLR